MKGERKTKYHTHVEPKLLLIEAWARDGTIDEDIAKKLGVAYSTFKLYKDQYSALSDALKKGKEVADIEVENALFRRALGYRYDEVTYEDGEETRRVTKEVQPDVTAQIFWLKNRKPVEWRDKQEIEHSGKMQHEVALEGLSDDELRERIATEVAAINDLQARVAAPNKG
ncbi:transposase [Paenibacillus sp. IITD108]|uniref:transposase n=1 Tax=Paenibacillus sp. IITD108 TaxID=3116649 RepID=UPI002F40C549